MAGDHPNLQNIPRSGPLRSYISAPEGRLFVIADYSQIELRIAAKISGDTEMLSDYAEGRDLHTLTARSLTGREETSKDDRKLSKAVNSASSTEWEQKGSGSTPSRATERI
jgi:DNA polymerase-1